MNRLLKSAALALGVSLIGTAAMACSGDCCAKDKDGKMACCDEMKAKDKAPASKGAEKPDPKAPAKPDPHAEHQHQ